MNILHYIALIAAAANVVRKVIDKKATQKMLYSDYSYRVNTEKLLRKYGIRLEEQFLAISHRNELLYSYVHVYIPSHIIELNKRNALSASLHKEVLTDSNGRNRLGDGHYVHLVSHIPIAHTELCKSKKLRERGLKKIKARHSAFRLAPYVGGIGSVKTILNQCANYIMSRLIINGDIPMDCLEAR